MTNLFRVAFDSIVMPVLEKPLRRGSLKAVKTYIQAVQLGRYAMMGLFGYSAFAALFVVGIFALIFGGVGLLPIEPRAMAITMLVIGAVLTVGCGIALAMIFNQRRWLSMSKSYEMMEAAMAPWPKSMPPNPRSVMRGDGPKVFQEEVKPTPVVSDPATMVPLMSPEIPFVPDPTLVEKRSVNSQSERRREELAPHILH